MKPIAEWTLGQKLKVLQYLTNIDYVEIVLEMGSYKEDDKTVFEIPIVVRKFMEKEMPEVWEEYLFCTTHSRGGHGCESCGAWEFDAYLFDKLLSLDNLLSFLLSNAEEWGWKECQMCKGRGWYNQTIQGEGTVGIYSMPCKCNTGKVKHPALLFAEGLK